MSDEVRRDKTYCGLYITATDILRWLKLDEWRRKHQQKIPTFCSAWNVIEERCPFASNYKLPNMVYDSKDWNLLKAVVLLVLKSNGRLPVVNFITLCDESSLSCDKRFATVNDDLTTWCEKKSTNLRQAIENISNSHTHVHEQPIPWYRWLITKPSIPWPFATCSLEFNW